MPFLQNAGQKVNFLFALVAVLYLVLLTIDFARYGGVIAPSWITAAFAIALGGWIGCRRSERLRGTARFCGTGRCVRRSACFSPPYPANFSHWRSKNRAPDENSDARILFYARHSRRAAGSKSGMA